jgi:hypothetical protein
MYTAFRWTLAAGILLSSACGGGGTDSGSSATYDLTVANRHLLTSTRSWTLTGTGPDNAAATAIFQYTASADTVTFPPTGETAGFLDVTASLTIAGTTETSTARIYFDPTRFLPIGARSRDHSSDTDSCDVQNTPPILPTVARLGDTGSNGASTGYVSCLAGAALKDHKTSAWSLESSGGLVLFCSTDVTTDVGTSDVLTSKECYELTADSTIGNRTTWTLSGAGGVISLSS